MFRVRSNILDASQVEKSDKYIISKCSISILDASGRMFLFGGDFVKEISEIWPNCYLYIQSGV